MVYILTRIFFKLLQLFFGNLRCIRKLLFYSPFGHLSKVVWAVFDFTQRRYAPLIVIKPRIKMLSNLALTCTKQIPLMRVKRMVMQEDCCEFL